MKTFPSAPPPFFCKLGRLPPCNTVTPMSPTIPYPISDCNRHIPRFPAFTKHGNWERHIKSKIR